MKKYVFFIFVFIVALGSALIWGYRNHLSQKGLIYYLHKRLGIMPQIESVEVSPNNLQINGLLVKEPFFEGRLERCDLAFGFSPLKKFQILSIDMTDGALTIYDAEKFRARISALLSAMKITQPANRPSQALPLSVSIKDIQLDLKDKKYFGLHLAASATGLLPENQPPIVKSIFINDLAFEKNGFILKGAISAPDLNSVLFSAHKLFWNDKEFKDIIISLHFDWPHKKIVLRDIRHEFIHPDSKISGTIMLDPFPPKIIRLNLETLSLAQTLNFFELDKEHAELTGMYSGSLDILLDGPLIADIQLSLRNAEGGTIIIKKESTLAFLHKYLDQESYDILIDNLKNYSYAIGNINLRRVGSSLILDMLFESEKLGKRDLTIDFHNILGGPQ